MPEKVPFDTQKALYTLAMEVLDLEPWTFLDEPDTFAVQPAPEDDTFYLCAIGSAGISRSLIFYRGAGGWDAFLRILSGDEDPSALIHVLDSLNLDFEPWKSLPPDIRKRMQRFGYGPGSGYLPAPVVYRPSRQPRDPDKAETGLLIRLLEAALPLLRRCRDNPGLLDNEDGLLLHRRPGRDGKTLEDAWSPPPDAPDPKAKTAPKEDILPARIKREKPPAGHPWEVHLGDMGAAVKMDRGTVLPMVFLLAEASSGFVTGIGMAPVDEMPVRLPHECLQAILKHKIRPSAFHVVREDVAAWLAPVAEELGIPVERKASLPQAEEAMRAFHTYMAETGPGKPPSGKRKSSRRK